MPTGCEAVVPAVIAVAAVAPTRICRLSPPWPTGGARPTECRPQPNTAISLWHWQRSVRRFNGLLQLHPAGRGVREGRPRRQPPRPADFELPAPPAGGCGELAAASSYIQGLTDAWAPSCDGYEGVCIECTHAAPSPPNAPSPPLALLCRRAARRAPLWSSWLSSWGRQCISRPHPAGTAPAGGVPLRPCRVRGTQH